MSGLREGAAFVALFLLTFACVALLVVVSAATQGGQTLGVTFSSKYAQDLGLDPDETFRAIVTDLGVRDVRIPVYWSDVEVAPGVFDFTALDRLMTFSAEHDVRVTLAIGMKVPRWPECFLPSFVDASSADFDNAVVRFVDAVVRHEKNSPALVRWQVENEPFFPFGSCPSLSIPRLHREFVQVRSLDSVHPLMTTVSGEQEPWSDVTSLVDTVGVSVYRFAYNATFGPVVFPHPAIFYRVQGLLTRLFVSDVIISELQMEPWFMGNPQNPASIDIPFSSKDFAEHLTFARQTGMHEILLWGVEWWYYQKVHGDSSLWDAAKNVF